MSTMSYVRGKSAAPNIIVFPAKQCAGVRKRASMSPEKKAKVGSVRHKHACLRCKMLKIPCSDAALCRSCLNLAIKGHQNKVLAFCYCIRTKFQEVNLFTREFSDASSLSSRLDRFYVTRVPTLDFPVEWNLDAVFSKAVGWLSSAPDSKPELSMTGVFSSIEFASLVWKHVDAVLLKHFQVLLHASSLAFVFGGQADMEGPPVSELQQMSHLAGMRLIDTLDSILSPHILGKATKETVQTLTLILLGTTIALGYAQTLDPSPVLPKDDEETPENRHQTLWEALRSHVSEMLAHHLIFLTSRLDIRFDKALQETLIRQASANWNKKARFTWNRRVNEEPPEPTWSSADLCSEHWQGTGSDAAVGGGISIFNYSSPHCATPDLCANNFRIIRVMKGDFEHEAPDSSEWMAECDMCGLVKMASRESYPFYLVRKGKSYWHDVCVSCYHRYADLDGWDSCHFCFPISASVRNGSSEPAGARVMQIHAPHHSKVKRRRQRRFV